jgi:hypothetical protein
MENQNFTNDLVSKFKNVVSSIETCFNMKLEVLNSKTEDDIVNSCNHFYSHLEDNDLFLLFVNTKIKVFSSKNENTDNFSRSLFGDDLLLKNVFNNQIDENKYHLWYSLLSLYKFMEENKQNRESRVEVLNDKITQLNKQLSSSIKDELFKTEVNKETGNMIDDIVGCFQNLVDDNKNPFENIMNVTTQISEKYFKDIENGNIEVDKILSGISLDTMKDGFFGKKEEEKKPVIIDENFSTADVEEGNEDEEDSGGMFGNVMKMANGMPDISNLTGMLNDIQNADDENEVMNIKSKMDSFLEKNMGIDMNEFNKSMGDLISKMENSDEDNLNVEQ